MTRTTTRAPRTPKVPVPDVLDRLLAERGADLRAAAAEAERATAATDALLPGRGNPS